MKDKESEHYHFIGIGGIGMSALALILAQKGVSVSGSDLALGYTATAMLKEGIRIYTGHAASNLPDKTTHVVYSSAVNEDNPEYSAALSRNLTLWHRSKLLHHLMKGFKPLLVTGTHGKTTTSALLAHILVFLHKDPSYAIGGSVLSLGGNGKNGRGEYFVAEADESDGSFLNYVPYGAIITNIDNDHLDYWKTEEKLTKGFEKFGKKVKSKDHLFVCQDDERLIKAVKEGVSYGFSEKSALMIQNFRQEQHRLFFDFTFDGKSYREVEVPLIGAHNVLNCSAAFGLALSLSIPEESIRSALLTFQGVGRRMEKKGEINGALLFDDYAHHPMEIFATLRAVKEAFSDRRVVAIFQPHRYSRTRDCMHQFPDAFVSADRVVLTDIYSAGQAPIEGVTTEVLFQKMTKELGSKVTYAPRNQLAEEVKKILKQGDLLITMGAGDITKLSSEIMAS